jgi:hypothetical protein
MQLAIPLVARCPHEEGVEVKRNILLKMRNSKRDRVLGKRQFECVD